MAEQRPDSSGISIAPATLGGLARPASVVASGKVRQLRGVVCAGVEHNSCVLVSDSGQLLAQLLGGPPAVLTEGRSVVVSGVFVTGLLTTAQQGAPFQVHAAEADPPSPG